jgi:tetratricopeptide (TPR) repeat protein
MVLVALSMTLQNAGAMSNTDKDRVTMAVEHTLMGDKSLTSASASITGWNNDMKLTVMLTDGFTIASAIVPISVIYIALINKFPDLGNLNVTFETKNGMIDSAYGLRSWAEQVREEGNSYNKDDLINFGTAMMLTLESTAKQIEWYNKGVALGNQGQYDEAIQAFDEAIRLDPNDVRAWNDKGLALVKQGKYDEAIETYDEAIRIDPNNSKAWNRKGTALTEQGKYDEAIKAYDEAIRLNPNYAMAWNNEGEALKALGRTTEANAAFAKAKELGYTE